MDGEISTFPVRIEGPRYDGKGAVDDESEGGGGREGDDGIRRRPMCALWRGETRKKGARATLGKVGKEAANRSETSHLEAPRVSRVTSLSAI